MTDRYKGFLITLEKEIRSDDAEQILTALKMVKGVFSVKPYVKNMEDYMAEEKGRMDLIKETIDFFHKRINK